MRLWNRRTAGRSRVKTCPTISKLGAFLTGPRRPGYTYTIARRPVRQPGRPSTAARDVGRRAIASRMLQARPKPPSSRSRTRVRKERTTAPRWCSTRTGCPVPGPRRPRAADIPLDPSDTSKLGELTKYIRLIGPRRARSASSSGYGPDRPATPREAGQLPATEHDATMTKRPRPSAIFAASRGRFAFYRRAWAVARPLPHGAIFRPAWAR